MSGDLDAPTDAIFERQQGDKAPNPVWATIRLERSQVRPSYGSTACIPETVQGGEIRRRC